jgi:hypothetical protein
LRSRNCFLALSYSALEATRQWSKGGCTAFADEQRSANITVMTTNDSAAAALRFNAYKNPPFIGTSPLTAYLDLPIKAVNDTNSQCKADDLETIVALACAKSEPTGRFLCPDLEARQVGRDLHISGGEQA